MTQDRAGIAERLRDMRPMPWDDDIADLGIEAAAHIEAQAVELERLHDLLKAVMNDTRGPLVGGGDGSTYVVRPISGETYNKIHAALKGPKP